MPGDMIIREGDIGDEMYFIREGEVDVLISTQEHPVRSSHADLAAHRLVIVRERGRDGPRCFFGRRSVFLRPKPDLPTARQLIAQVATKVSGEFFGEIALLHQVTRTASIRAQIYTELMALRRKHLEEIVEYHPQARNFRDSSLLIYKE